METRWRMPVAVAAAALLALSVYQFAERAQHPQTVTPVPRIAAFDTGSLVALQELLRAVVPTDEIIPATNTGSDALLTALAWSGVMNVSPQAEPPQAGALSDADLDGINGLIGGPTDA
jgi:hypothetical protein